MEKNEVSHMIAPPSALTEFPGHGLPELKDGAAFGKTKAFRICRIES